MCTHEVVVGRVGLWGLFRRTVGSARITGVYFFRVRDDNSKAERYYDTCIQVAIDSPYQTDYNRRSDRTC